MTVFGFLSTYPPTRCGLATFTESLAAALVESSGSDSRVVRVDDLVPSGPAKPSAGTTVVGDLRPDSRASRIAAARVLDTCDVVVVQHEFGIYGGRDGDEILDVLARLTAPTVVVFHTVREAPSVHQRRLIDLIGGMASAVVVMTRAARDLLADGYAVPMAKVRIIPHGVPNWTPVIAPDPEVRPVILTWGLLGPGKGIEWGIRALTELAVLEPRPLYRIAGQTHPKVLAHSGEAYRTALATLAEDLGVTADVDIDGRYRDTAELAGLVARADIVLLPYDSRDQTTSGVLVEAVAAGKPVIATRFPHAVELLAGGAGVIVEQGDSHGIAEAIRAMLGTDRVATRGAVPETHGAGWSAVAEQYRLLATALAGADAA